MKLIILLLVMIQYSICSAQSGYFGFKSSYNKQALFSLNVDDVNASDSTVLRIMREYSLLPSFAIRADQLNAERKIRYLGYWRLGCSLLAHSVSHAAIFNNPSTPVATIRSEMLDSRDSIINMGATVSGWVTPQSILNPAFYYLEDSIFNYGFVNLNLDFSDTLNRKRMSRYGLEANILDSITRMIDTAIKYKRMVTFYMHQLPSTTLIGGVTSLDETKLRAVLSYIRTKVDARLCRFLNTDNAVGKFYQ